MVELVGVDRLEDAHIIHNGGEVWQHLREFGSDTDLAVFGELEPRAEYRGIGTDEGGTVAPGPGPPAAAALPS